MIPAGRNWLRREGARPEALQRLRSLSPVDLPEAYYQLMAFSNGGEGPISKQPYYFQLDPVEWASEALHRGLEDEFFPGFIIFGSNGGGEYIAFDVRGPPPWPIVALDMTNATLEESLLPIASNFDEFLDLVGVESAADGKVDG